MQYIIDEACKRIQVELLPDGKTEPTETELGSVMAKIHTTFYDTAGNIKDVYKDIVMMYFDNAGNIYRHRDSEVWFNVREQLCIQSM